MVALRLVIRAVLAGACASLVHAQSSPSCAVTGTVSAGQVPLPGVVLSLAALDNVSGDVADVTSSAPDGTYSLKAPRPGQYALKAELTAFAPFSRDLTIDSNNCSARLEARLDVPMVLASRAGAPAAAIAATAQREAQAANAQTPTRAGGRGQLDRRVPAGGGRGPQQEFQTLQLLADQTGLGRADDSASSDSAAQVLLPPGFSADAATESVATVGSAQASTAFGPGGLGGFGDRFGDGIGGAFGDASAGQGPGPGGRGGGPGAFGQGAGGIGPIGGFGGLFGRDRGNQIRGSLSQTVDTSALDAAPFALNGQGTPKPSYLQQRLAATIGGPLTIPKIVDSPRTFFFVNYTGNHSRNPYDAYSTVPTPAERSGDLSGIRRAVVDPTSGLPFSNNQIPASQVDPAAQRLLSLIPLPNQAGDRQNFHSVTTTTSQLDDANVRLVRTFGSPPERQRGGGGGGRSFGGGRGGLGGMSNLNMGLHYHRSNSTNANPFPTLGGTSNLTAWDLPVGYTFTRAGMLHSLRFGFNLQRANSQNQYAFNQNVAGQAGLFGVSSDPFDWGAPGLSFSAFSSVRDMNPSTRTDRTLSIGDATVKTHGAHTIRFGGDYRDIRADSRSDQNARGSFVFTGLYSGVDFADFLLGLPQQSAVQYSLEQQRFRSRSWDLFVQDDWRAKPKLTVNAGIRYEYYSPYSEANNRLVTLDAAPGFTAAVPVVAGATGPFSGSLPETVVRPSRNSFAPRVGIAWRPLSSTSSATSTIVRASYGINYNSSVYQTIAQQLAGQPPFAIAGTVLATATAPVPLETALQNIDPTTTTNTYAVDPNFRLPFVQIWNVGIQRDVTRTVTVDVSYTGTKGSNLDIVRAPNRNPDGSLRITGVAPFLWESSGGDSILHSMTVRARKRMASGLAANVTYTLSRSIDNASSIAGGAVVVAQNDQDLAAERSLSSFDQRHRLSAETTYDLPFGEDRRWLTGGAGAALLGHWQMNATVQLATGTPFTARVLGAIRDVATGVNGTLRANYNGDSITVNDPTTALFFNTAAFSIPSPGTFGNAGRNTIIGPGTSSVNFGLQRSVPIGATRSLSFQLQATNVFNDVQYASIDTVVNSPTFGRVTAARPMRRVQFTTRFRF